MKEESNTNPNPKPNTNIIRGAAPNGELVDKTTELNFKTIIINIVNYMGIPRLLLALIFLLLTVICDISDPPLQYLMNPLANKGDLHYLPKSLHKHLIIGISRHKCTHSPYV